MRYAQRKRAQFGRRAAKSFPERIDCRGGGASLILLVGSGLILNSFVRLSKVPPGVIARNVLTMQVVLSDKKYQDSERRAACFERALERIENLPGVEAAGVTGTMPMAGWWQNTTFSIIGRAGQPAVGYETDFDFCTPDYFRAAGIPLVKGAEHPRWKSLHWFRAAPQPEAETLQLILTFMLTLGWKEPHSHQRLLWNLEVGAGEGNRTLVIIPLACF